LICRPEQADRREQQDKGSYRSPCFAIQRCGYGGTLFKGIFWQSRGCRQINSQTDGHPNAGGSKPIVPAKLFAERSADKRGKKCTEIDADVEDRKGAVSAPVPRRIEGADLGRNVGLECPIAEDKKAER